MKRTASALALISMLLITLMLVASFPSLETGYAAFSPAEWSRRIGGTDNDVAYSLIQTRDSGYAIAGFIGPYQTGSDTAFLVKTDFNGYVQWQKTYGGKDHTCGYSVIQTSDGGYAIVGYFSQVNPVNSKGYDVYLVKTDADGNMEWNKTYGGASDDCGYDVVQTVDGGYAIAGSVNFNGGMNQGDAWLVKTDSAGNMRWNRTFGGSKNDVAQSLVQTNEGGYVIAGVTDFFYGDRGEDYLVKTDSLGNLEWQKTYEQTDMSYRHSVVQSIDRGYVIAIGGAALVKTDKMGNVQWKKTYDSPIILGDGYPSPSYSDWSSVVQTRDGGYALAGSVGGYSDTLNYVNSEMCLVKTDSNGNLQWQKTSRGTSNGNYGGHSAIQASDGGYAIVGYTDYWAESNSGGSKSDIYFVKMADENPIPTLSREPAGDVQANEPVKISASVTYAASQIKNATLFYLLNNASLWEGRAEMSLNTSTNLYEASIPGQTNGTTVQFRVGFRVVDNNVAEMSVAREEAAYTVNPVAPPLPPSISISVDASSTVAGQAVNVNGRLSDSNGNPIPDKSVTLSYAVADSASWVPIASGTTNAAGEYNIQWVNTASGTFTLQVEWSGDAEYPGASTTATTSFLPYENQNVFLVESNSTVSALVFDSTSSELSFTVSGPSGTTGYVKATIAKSLVSNAENIKVYLDGNQLNCEITSNSNSWVLTFNYQHSTHQVRINLATNGVGDTFSWIWIAATIIIVVAVAIGLVAWRKKKKS